MGLDVFFDWDSARSVAWFLPLVGRFGHLQYFFTVFFPTVGSIGEMQSPLGRWQLEGSGGKERAFGASKLESWWLKDIKAFSFMSSLVFFWGGLGERILMNFSLIWIWNSDILGRDKLVYNLWQCKGLWMFQVLEMVNRKEWVTFAVDEDAEIYQTAIFGSGYFNKLHITILRNFDLLRAFSQSHARSAFCGDWWINRRFWRWGICRCLS